MKRKPERFWGAMITLWPVVAALWALMLGYAAGEAEAVQVFFGDSLSGMDALVHTPSAVLLAIAGGSVLLIFLFSWVLSRHIRNVTARYHERITVRENALEAFNASVEAQVEAQVRKQRRGEKMMIQHAKMSAIAEVLSMITQRWRIPVRETSQALESLVSSRHSDSAPVADAQRVLDALMQTIELYHTRFCPDKARETVDLQELIAQTLVLVEETITQQGITLHTRIDAILTLPLYRNELIQVLINLLQNAAEGLADASIAHPHIGIECYETGQYAVIRICDNGGGIDEPTAAKMFDPYFTTKAYGSGIGLYLSRIIIEEHFSGQLLFENSDDGACFFVKIGKHQS